MRLKVLFIVVLMSLISVNLAQGQVDALGTTFVSIGGGLNTYANDHLGLMDTRGKAFEGTLGTWVSGSVGMRGQLSLQYATNLDTAQSAYYYGHFDLFWSPVSSFCGFTPNRPFDLRLLYGIGLVHAVAHSDNDFSLDVGLQFAARIQDRLWAYLEVKDYIHPSLFDNNEFISHVATASVGLSYHLNENAAYGKTNVFQPTPTSDWFVNFAVLGVNMLQYRGAGPLSERTDLLSPAAEIAIGKNFTVTWGGRLALSGIQLKSREAIPQPYGAADKILEQNYSFYTFHGDIMCNLSHLVTQQDYFNRLSVYGYVGAGVIYRPDYSSQKQAVFMGGLFGKFLLTYHSDIFFDMRYGYTPSRFMHLTIPQGRFSVGMVTVSMGYVYNFGDSRCRRVSVSR